MRNLSYDSATAAVTNAVKYLQNEVNVNKIFGFGISMSSAAIGLNEKQLFSATALLSYSPLVNTRSLYDRYENNINSQLDDIKDRGYAIMNSASGRGSFEMGGEWIEQMKEHSAEYSKRFENNPTPAILIQGTNGDYYDEDRYGAFVEKNNKKSVLIKGADHNFNSKNHRDEVLKHVDDFFSSYLNND